MKRRVVVTGMGAVTPVGNSVEEMWEALKKGQCGIDFIKQFDPSHMKVQIAGEVKDLNPEKYLDAREVRKLDRSAVFALVAAGEAYDSSNLENARIDPDRFGVFVTSGIGGIETIYYETLKSLEKGPDRVTPFFIPNSIINLIGGRISIKYQAKGPTLAVVSSCASATNSIGEAFRYIRDGYVDLAFAGGTEAPLNEIAVGGFTTMRALNMSNDPNNASTPFDKRRSGFVMAEGAGVLILEEYEHAKARGAKIYAEMVGYGVTSDAFHITAPDETADGIIKCMKNALKDAQIEPEEIDYINPHGTSTPFNDKIETLGIKKVFGEHAKKISVSATKSMTGHSLGAVGGIEAIISIKTLMEDEIPPMIHYQEADEECDLNFVLDKPISRKVNYALSNSLGFGGHNATIIFKKITE